MFIFLMMRRRTRSFKFVSLVSSQGAGHQLVPGALLIEHGLAKTGLMMVEVVVVVVVVILEALVVANVLAVVVYIVNRRLHFVGVLVQLFLILLI